MVLASLQNIAGVDSFGQKVNAFLGSGSVRGIRMTTRKYSPDHPKYGCLALVTLHEPVTYTSQWKGDERFDAQSLFWNDFSGDGRLDGVAESDPSPEGRNLVGYPPFDLTLGKERRSKTENEAKGPHRHIESTL